jgi:hypothetical protein
VLKENRDSSDQATGDLITAFEEAKAAKLGIHCGKSKRYDTSMLDCFVGFADNMELKRSSVRRVNWNLDAESFFKDLSKGSRRGRESPVATVIFEHVRDGATFRLFLCLSE